MPINKIKKMKYEGALIAGICGYFAKDVYNWIKKGVFKKIAEIKKKRKRKKYPYIDTD